MSDLKKIKRALISVSDKAGVVELARGLAEFGIELISTGGTAQALRAAGLAVTDVSGVTGFPEMMDGRVKTLHPNIHGAFLALRDNAEHLDSMRKHSIEPIDMAVVNLYPFEQTAARSGVRLEEAVENIDIGGPAMIRSASKNWRDVAVVTAPNLYPEIIDELRLNDGALSLKTRQRLATLAYTRTASYDLAISSYLSKQLSDEDLAFLEPMNPLGHLVFIDSNEVDEPSEDTGTLPSHSTLELVKAVDLRYGENPHQQAALYQTGASAGLANAEQLHGKEMSFNNYVDAEAAWNLINDFDNQAAAIIKHTNPSGVGVGNSNEEAYRRALSTDPISAFGGIVVFNRVVDAAVAASVTEVFTEVVLAPGFEPEALDILRSKKNLRVLRVQGDDLSSRERLQFKQISGGMLIQTNDSHIISANDLTIVSERRPSEADIAALMLAWKVCKHVKSNAIVIANETQTLGVGAGQMNRVDSLRIAAMRAERFDLPINGAALASDAFFPFRDNVDEAARLGISAIIQPGGSIKDDESIQAANEHGIAMVFTGVRHFCH
ncbi:MAG: bifunctional phosphoribosylaminoimidazolecarboxamide formyltransferase/IMP cyclohydrolase [Pyrinomonadaceae bacterium]